MVSPNEGNEVRRDERQGVGASHSTDEAGEPYRRDPAEGRGCRFKQPLEGNMAGASEPVDVSTKQQRIADKRRVRDGVLLRLIGKWLNAGVLEDGCVTHSEAGSPQGGVVSPMLSNVFPHYVLDDWFEREVQPRLKGHSFLIRFADDFVMGFTCEEDARKVMDVLPKRFEKYDLTIHPEKTRLVPFERPSDRPKPSATATRVPAGSFDLLGFTHYWGRSRQGYWVVKRKTSKSRLRRGLTAIAQWCRKNRHQALAAQQSTLSQKIRGHCAYYGITGNASALSQFRSGVVEIWRKWLGRRHRGGEVTWERMHRLLERYPLPPAIVIHSVYRRPAKV
jgi:RNA-directed DNA polymerase